MTTIKATCPGCGEVPLCPWQITLTEDQYSFDCPSCGEKVHKPADDRVIRLLLSGGVEQTRTVPVVKPRFDFPAFVHDDLLDFHLLLDGPDWQAELARGS